ANVQTQSNSAETQLNAEHNASGTHKTINTPNVVTNKITLPDGTISSSKNIGGTAQTLSAAMALGKEADLGANDFALTQNGRDLLRVDAQRGLMGMIGNIQSPLTSLPMKRAGEITGAAAALGAMYSGAATFTRASTGTYIDSLTGLVKTALPNEMRFERMADGGVGVLLEGSSTNYLLNSATGWSAGGGLGTLLPSTTPCPDGTLSGKTYTFALNGYAVISNASVFTIPSATGNTASVYLNVPVGQTVTLDVYNNTSTVYIGSTTHIGTGSYSRTEVNLPGITAGNSITIYLHMVGFAVGEQFDVWAGQIEPLPRATSYIPTTTAAVTRAADSLTIPASGNLVKSGFTAVVDAQSLGGSVAKEFTDIFNVLGLVNTVVRLDHSLSKARCYAGGAGENILSPVLDLKAPHRYAFSLSASFLLKFYIDGVLIGSMQSSAATGAATNITFSGAGGWSDGYSLSSNVKIYDQALTDQEIGAL
ncbi:MAG: hypothetical protein R8M45_00185, partial [Ghiorsea sp.]